jgi:NADH:ubiquinone oxidoreductase subunit F (NADH-binding)
VSSPQLLAPTGVTRLLELVPADGSAANLETHLRRYGEPPLRGYAGPAAPQPLIDTVTRANLRGRGGAGFPIAIKLQAVARRAGGNAIVVANGAESEPLSAKDALLLACVPHLVVDGAVIAADSIGARTVHLVVREGAPYEAVRAALAQRTDPVLVQLHRAPAGYVSSQDTAIISWLNGRPAMPTFTPPLPVERGVGGRPTLVSNVETLAHLALIARYGAEWYRGVGTGSAPGTTLLTVCGAVESPGVLETAFGTPLEEALRPAAPDSRADTLLVGGWFGGWVTRREASTLTIDPAVLAAAGTGLGAGVLYVMPPHACGLRYAADAARWLANASVGQCGPCINGLPAIASALDDVAKAQRTEAALTNLRRWCALMPDRGACRHPDGTARFVTTAVKVFAADVRAHQRGECLGVRRVAS